MKDLLPSSLSELKENLFLVPSVSKKLLRNGVPRCHQVRYALTCDNHVLGVHVDSQNERRVFSDITSSMTVSGGCMCE
eukprot:7564839-Ditylum_brightwellii.AAC.1